MSELVAVDASTPSGGDQFYLVGVAVEVSDAEEFDSYYFDFVTDFCEAYGIETPFSVIKSKTATSQLASYQIRDGMDELFEGVLKNPAIERLHVCIGWYGGTAELEFKNKELRGIDFASNYLSQYFPVVTLWRYHRSHRYNLPTLALVDNVQGHITKAWKYVGNEFDIRMVPHGDLTYPAVSTADILAYGLADRMPSGEPFTEYPDVAKRWLISNRNESTSPYVDSGPVNERYTDHIVPTLPYSIRAELHHPHPVLFVHDTVLSGDDNKVFPQTDFHGLARQWAFDNEGSVVNLQINRLPSIVRDGDVIVHTKGTERTRSELMQDLHPTKDITVWNSDELIQRVLDY